MGLEGGLVAGPGNSQIRLKLKNKLKLRYKLKLKYKLEYKLKLRYKLTCRGDLLGRGESASVHFACLPEDHFYENKYGQNLTKTTSAHCACLPEDHFDEKIFRQICHFFFYKHFLFESAFLKTTLMKVTMKLAFLFSVNS